MDLKKDGGLELEEIKSTSRNAESNSQGDRVRTQSDKRRTAEKMIESPPNIQQVDSSDSSSPFKDVREVKGVKTQSFVAGEIPGKLSGNLEMLQKKKSARKSKPAIMFGKLTSAENNEKVDGSGDICSNSNTETES